MQVSAVRQAIPADADAVYLLLREARRRQGCVDLASAAMDDDEGGLGGRRGDGGPPQIIRIGEDFGRHFE